MDKKGIIFSCKTRVFLSFQKFIKIKWNNFKMTDNNLLMAYNTLPEHIIIEICSNLDSNSLFEALKVFTK